MKKNDSVPLQRSQRVWGSAFIAAACAVIIVSSPSLSFAQHYAPPVVVFPTQNHPDSPAPLRDACLNPSGWQTGFSRMTMFGNAWQFWQEWSNDAEVATCLANLRTSGKTLGIEVPVLKWHCQSAQACWNQFESTLERLVALSAPEIWLVFDEPITTNGFGATDAFIVDQTAEMVSLARNRFPGTNIIIHEAYPTQSASALITFFTQVNSATIAQTGFGIQYASVDHDWNAGGSLSDLLNIQSGVRNAGMGFGVVFWNADPGRTWYDGLLFQGSGYRQWRAFGLLPDMALILNWNGNPFDTIPEASPGTFMRSVRDFVHQFLPTPTLAPNESLLAGESRTSPDGRFTLIYQTDGNLVLYQGSGDLWHINKSGYSTGQAVMQGDGNLVVYDGNGEAIWSSGTSGTTGAFLAVQSDGNLVIYTPTTSVPLWSSNTNCC